MRASGACGAVSHAHSRMHPPTPAGMELRPAADGVIEGTGHFHVFIDSPGAQQAACHPMLQCLGEMGFTPGMGSCPLLGSKPQPERLVRALASAPTRLHAPPRTPQMWLPAWPSPLMTPTSILARRRPPQVRVPPAPPRVPRALPTGAGDGVGVWSHAARTQREATGPADRGAPLAGPQTWSWHLASTS